MSWLSRAWTERDREEQRRAPQVRRAHAVNTAPPGASPAQAGNGIDGFGDGAGPADSVCADHTDPNLRERRLGTPGRPPGLLRRLSDCVVRVELPGSTT